MIESIALWLSISATVMLMLYRYRYVSLPSLGVIGLLAYTLPALFGTFRSPVTGDYLTVSPDGTLVMMWGWSGYLIGLLVTFIHPQKQMPRVGPEHLRTGDVFPAIAASLSAIGYALIAARLGMDFFLQPRGTTAVLGAPYMVWKWIPAVGLVASVVYGKRITFFVSIVFLTVVAISGDRTVPLIAMAAAIFVYFSQFTHLRASLSPGAIISIASALAVIFLTKPAYVFLKTGSLPPIDLTSLLQYWEAFTTHSILEKIIETNWSYPLSEMLIGVSAQFLIVPSALGIHSNAFNTAFQGELFPHVSFGLAYNYWAQWYAVIGQFGVFTGGFILAAALSSLDRFAHTRNGLTQTFAILAGATIAIYIHRNSLENIIALLRQPLIAFIMIWLVSWFVSRPGFPKRVVLKIK